MVFGMFVKVCGVRTEADVAAVVAAGADAVGFVLTDSVRRVEPGTARLLAAGVPPEVLTVGVVHGVPAAEAARLGLAAGVRAVQLHGGYPRSAFEELAGLPFQLIRATTLDAGTDVRVGAYGEDLLLLDSPVAGSGERWDLSLLGAAPPEGKWLLAGGLRPDNVAEAVGAVRPWGVDVSSGVESSRGVKDHDLIHRFVAAARTAAA
ncbi:N-(5'-phosphoribosyl)anthranilate isomerase [Catellatospora sp. TT07R-123]|nr:N-(5'-phosphoribosyl)anthranilate isomerase [Catellatospora sp. TT07R-123]